MSTKFQKKLFAAAQYVLTFAFAAFLIWWSLHNLTGEDVAIIKNAFAKARYSLLVIVFIILFLSHLFRALRWQQLIASLNYKTKWYHLLYGFLTGLLVNEFVPRAGEVIRCTLVAKKDNVPVEKVIGTVITERAIDIVCLIIIAFITFFLEYRFIENIAQSFVNFIRQNAGRFILILLIIVFIILLFNQLAKKLSSYKWMMSLKKTGKGLKDGIISVAKVKNKLLFIIYTILIWSGYAVTTWIGCFALEETAHLHFSAGIVLLISGTIGIIIAPGGLGAYPIAIQQALSLYGIATNIGIAAGWLLWSAQFIFTTLLGFMAFIFMQGSASIKQPVPIKENK